jgi:hypothetical protein
MSAARKIAYTSFRKHARDNTFSGSIDEALPLDFKTTFSQITYPQEGEPPRWTIDANYRNPDNNHIQTIRVIFFKDPAASLVQRLAENFKITYSNTEEDPPSEYSSPEADIAIKFNSENATISGTISATLTDQLDPPKTHTLDLDFDLAAF